VGSPTPPLTATPPLTSSPFERPAGHAGTPRSSDGCSEHRLQTPPPASRVATPTVADVLLADAQREIGNEIADGLRGRDGMLLMGRDGMGTLVPLAEMAKAEAEAKVDARAGPMEAEAARLEGAAGPSPAATEAGAEVEAEAPLEMASIAMLEELMAAASMAASGPEAPTLHHGAAKETMKNLLLDAGVPGQADGEEVRPGLVLMPSVLDSLDEPAPVRQPSALPQEEPSPMRPQASPLGDGAQQPSPMSPAQSSRELQQNLGSLSAYVVGGEWLSLGAFGDDDTGERQSQ